MSVIYPHDSTARTFKACRSCRSQKSKCRGEPGAPCDRCQATGRDCVFDLLGSNKRLQDNEEASDLDASKRARSHRLENEVLELRRDVNALLNRLDGRPTAPSPPDNTGGNETRSHASSIVSPGQSQGPNSNRMPTDGLNLFQLETPITSMHDMASGIGSPPETPSTAAESSAYGVSGSKYQAHRHISGDVITKGLIAESDARQAFHLYMAHANVFLPLFDPVLDSFDNLRRESIFCFTAVLAIALRVRNDAPNMIELSQSCWEEASKLSAQSLFATSTDLRTVQGMLLLASYTEKNWYAIKHARQLAEDLRLNECLLRLSAQVMMNSQRSTSRADERVLMQSARAWLILQYVDQEVIDGSGRSSTLRNVESDLLRKFVSNVHAESSDVRIASTIEIVQIRGAFLRNIRHADDLPETVEDRLEQLRSQVDNWYKCWSDVYEDHGLPTDSFQRSSLRIQKGYALIIGSSAIISRLGREMHGKLLSQAQVDLRDAITHSTVAAIIDQLKLICENDAYRWNFAWAPVYSALMLTFIAALALGLARHQPQLIHAPTVTTTTAVVVRILEAYPHPRYASLLRNLITNTSEQPQAQTDSQSLYSIQRNSQHPRGIAGSPAGVASSHPRVAMNNRSSPTSLPAKAWTSPNALDIRQTALYPSEAWPALMNAQVPMNFSWDQHFQNDVEDLTLSTMFDFNAFTASMGM